jgi:glyoxylase-like metal-dependent hydrolase (beta-lactamase superfamily II)
MSMRYVICTAMACAWVFAPCCASAQVAQQSAESALSAQALRGNLQVVHGDGSNVVVSTGADGTLLVDGEYASATTRLRKTLAALAAAQVKVLINTHWHNDHTGGNEAFGREGALIIAQQDSAQRLRDEQTMSLYGKQAAAPPVAWPKVIVQDSMHMRWNDDEIDLLHPAPAHTGGDLVVFFRQQDVLCTGDLFVTGNYLPPYFDDLNGGSTEGMIAAADWLLGLAGARTAIVPGHGPPSDRAGLQRYRDQLVALRQRVREALAQGLSEDAAVALHPAGDFYGAGRGVDRLVRILYREYHR